MADPESELEKVKAQRQALADFGLFAFQCDDMDRLLHRAAEMVSQATGVPLVKILEHRPARSQMLMKAGVNWQPGVVGKEVFGDDDRSPSGFALRTEHAVVSPDVDSEERFEIPDVLRRHGVRSMVNVVIAGKGAPYGVLEADAQERRTFSDDDVAFLRTYANLLAAAIDRMKSNAELARAAREQNLLARELAHRVGNLFALVRALASQTSVDNRTAGQFRKVFTDRLMALAVAEGLVSRSRDGRIDVRDLAITILAPYRFDDPKRIAIDGPSIRFTERQSRMLGLALHELATNAAKHGALSGDGGKVRLNWKTERREESHDLVSVIWEETDGPQVAPPTRNGFGTHLLQLAVAQELNGRSNLSYRPLGVLYQLKFPLDET